MTVDATTIAVVSSLVMGILALVAIVKYLAGLAWAQLQARLDECEERHKKCEQLSLAQQDQIDAILDGDFDRAKKKRHTETLPTVQDPPQNPTSGGSTNKKLPAKLRAGFALLFAIFALCAAGCASQASSVGTRHAVEKRQTFVVIPATADAPAQVMPVTETTETWEDTSAKHESNSGPDIKQIAPVVQSVATAATAGVSAGSGTGIMALLTTVGTGLLAYGAREVLARKDQNRQNQEAQERIDRLRQDRDEARKRAEAYALKLPPQSPQSPQEEHG